MHRASARIAKMGPPITGLTSPIGATGPHPLERLARRDPPGGGITLGRAIGREMQQATMQEAGRVTFTTAHTVRTFQGETLTTPQIFVRTAQGSPQSPVNIEATASRIRLSRRSLNRNRGRLER